MLTLVWPGGTSWRTVGLDPLAPPTIRKGTRPSSGSDQVTRAVPAPIATATCAGADGRRGGWCRSPPDRAAIATVVAAINAATRPPATIQRFRVRVPECSVIAAVVAGAGVAGEVTSWSGAPLR